MTVAIINPAVAQPRPWTRLADLFGRGRPFLVRSIGGRPKVVFLPWTTTLRGSVKFGKRVRVLPRTTLDARAGSIVIGDETVLCRNVVMEAAGGPIEIGRRSSLGDFSNVYGQGGLQIGDDVLIASGCRIVPSQHVFAKANLPIRAQGITGLGIYIEDDVWIGTNVTVLDGCRVRSGAIIGAGAVVTRSVDRHSIVAGVPARVVGTRGAV